MTMKLLAAIGIMVLIFWAGHQVWSAVSNFAPATGTVTEEWR